MGRVRRPSVAHSRPFCAQIAPSSSRGYATGVKRLSIAGLSVWATGGTDRDGGGDGPAIVLCHGFGAPGDDLVSLARVLEVGRDVRFFFPEAPLAIDFGGGAVGRAWWMIDMERLMALRERGETRQLADETPDGLAEARAALEGVLAELATSHGVARSRTLLGGFSQGSMLATEIALHAEEPFAGLAVWSGALLSEPRWRAAAKARAASIHAIVTHGRRDPILPFAGGEALRDLLVEYGADVRFVPHNGAHEIPESALAALTELARARLS